MTTLLRAPSMHAEAPPGLPGWVRAAAAGDTAGQARLVREQWPLAERMLLRILGPRQDLEDLLQVVFLETLRALPRFEGRSRLSTFVGGVTVRVAMRAMRQSARAPHLVPVDEATAPAGTDLERQLRARQHLRLVRGWLRELSEVKRVAFLLWAVDGMAVGDIAEMMDASLPATRSRIFYAQKALKAHATGHPELATLIGGADG